MGLGVKTKKWIQSSIKRPGDFTAWCKAQGFKGVTEACIALGKKSKSKRRRLQANEAKTLRRLAKKRRKKKK